MHSNGMGVSVGHSPAVVAVGYAVVLVPGVILFGKLPGSFVPEENQSGVIASVELPAGSTLQRTEDVLYRSTREFGIRLHSRHSMGRAQPDGGSVRQLGQYDRASSDSRRASVREQPPGLPRMGSFGGSTSTWTIVAAWAHLQHAGVVGEHGTAMSPWRRCPWTAPASDPP